MYKYSMYGKTNKINSSFFENVVFLVETLFLFVYKKEDVLALHNN